MPNYQSICRSLQRHGLCGVEGLARTHVGVRQALDLRLHRSVQVRVGSDAQLRRQEGGALAAQHTDLGQLRLYLTQAEAAEAWRKLGGSLAEAWRKLRRCRRLGPRPRRQMAEEAEGAARAMTEQAAVA